MVGKLHCWYMDNSSFPEESEILIIDGMTFIVKSVGKELIEGKLLVVINLQVSYKYY
jgi:hypothetical protein